MASPTPEAINAERDKLRRVCAAAYLLAGLVDAPVRFLDALSDAANGEVGKRADPETLIPVSLDEEGAFRPLIAREQAIFAALDIDPKLPDSATLAIAREFKRKVDAYAKLTEALREIALCMVPGVPDRATVTMDKVGVFAFERAREALKDIGENLK